MREEVTALISAGFDPMALCLGYEQVSGCVVPHAGVLSGLKTVNGLGEVV